MGSLISLQAVAPLITRIISVTLSLIEIMVVLWPCYRRRYTQTTVQVVSLTLCKRMVLNLYSVFLSCCVRQLLTSFCFLSWFFGFGGLGLMQFSVPGCNSVYFKNLFYLTSESCSWFCDRQTVTEAGKSCLESRSSTTVLSKIEELLYSVQYKTKTFHDNGTMYP